MPLPWKKSQATPESPSDSEASQAQSQASSETDAQTQAPQADALTPLLLQKLEELERKLQAPQPSAQPSAQPEAPTHNNTPSVFEDEEAAFRSRIAPLAVATLNVANEVAFMKFLTALSPRDRAIYDKYANEVEAEAKLYAPGQLATPEAWRRIFDMIKGRHADELAAVSVPVIEGVGGKSPAPPTPKPPEEAALPEPVLKMLRGLKISPKDYVEARRRLNIQVEE
jgi:hypothetical protein